MLTETSAASPTASKPAFVMDTMEGVTQRAAQRYVPRVPVAHLVVEGDG